MFKRQLLLLDVSSIMLYADRAVMAPLGMAQGTKKSKRELPQRALYIYTCLREMHPARDVVREE